MHLQSPSRGALLALAALAGVAAAADDATKTTTTSTPAVTPCVATATSGAFFDLRPDAAVVVPKDEKPPKGVPTEDYLARGWDYGSNFTLNICNPVVKRVDDVVGVEKALWKNISAYYETKGKIYSLGYGFALNLRLIQYVDVFGRQSSGALVPRGRKLVLQYTRGSPCGTSDKRSSKRASVHEGARYKYHDFDDEEQEEDYSARRTSKTDDDKDEKKDKDKSKDKDDKSTPLRRKSATISFLCDHDPDTPTAFSFVGTDPDECAYFFEVRSQHACAGAEPHKPGSVGPGSVFAIIFFIAVLVYVVGGVFYQRTVAHARGWRQLPNYSLWSGIWSFVKVSCWACQWRLRGMASLTWLRYRICLSS
jgi:cation-dependent mannose-6-phosphate receptor